MEALFRLNGAVKHHEAIDAWLDERDSELGAIARTWFSYMRRCGDDVHELIHDGCPVACVEDAAFAYVNVFKAHVNVGFYHGAGMEDPMGLLEGAGRRMRHVKLMPGGNIDVVALARLIDLAYADIRRRLETAAM